MNVYEVVRFIHVASAVALLGGSVIGSPGVRAAAQRARTTQEVRAYLSIGRPLLVLEPIAALAVLASGVYLTSAAGFWAVGWIQVAAVFWLVNAVIAGTLVKLAMSRLAAAADRAADGAVGPRLDTLRSSPAWGFGGDLLKANDAAMLYLMVLKPELIGSLVVIVAANLAVAAARVFRRGAGARGGAATESRM